ncbi:MAG: hypothetical protein ACU85U_01965 [Gammaproteobacteria bacterium]|jgi:hypothetical protein
MVKKILPTLVAILLAPVVCAMDPFPDPIPPGPVTARIVDYATVPDASPNLPPRLSVLTADPSGRLFVADIGQNAVEEINLAVNGGNFGWNEREGSFAFAGDIPSGLIFSLDVDDDPLAGGQQGLQELRLVDEQFDPVRLIDVVNKKRATRGLAATSRADLRFGVSTGGDIFVRNKHDGIVRKLMALP